MPVLETGGSDSSVDVLVKTIADTTGAAATSAALEDMGAKAKAQAASAGASFEKFNTTLGSVSGSAVKVGDSMTKYVTLPMVAVAGESVKMAMNFQQTMEMLKTNAGVAQGAIAGLSEQVLALAPQVGAGPEKLAEALYHIESAGNGIWSTAQQMDILKTAAQGAAIGQANLDDTTYALTSALASNVKGAKDASEMMAVLNATVGAGDMKLQDLNGAIGTGFLGTAATFGISIQSVGAALATLTDNGEHADAAATRLRMTWALMTAPSKQASELMGELGLSAEDAAVSTKGMSEVFAKTGLSTTKLADDLRQPNGMTVALRDLQTHLEKAGLSASETDAILSKTFGGGRTDAALLTMLQNLDRMDEKYNLINADTSKFGENWAAQQQTAKQQFNDAWAGIEANLIKLGDEVMPAATKIMKEFSGDVQAVAHWFGGLTDGEQQFILKTGLVIATAGPAILILGKFGKAAADLGDLVIKSSKALGLFKTEGMIAEAAKGAGALGKGAGLAGAVEGLLPEAGGLAAILGPVALGIAGVAAVGIGTAIVVHHIADAHKEAAQKANDQLQAEKKVADQLKTGTGATTVATKLTSDYSKASDTAAQKDAAQKKAKEDLNKAQDTYNETAKKTADALKKYGPDSSQYLDALEKQASAQTQLSKATDAWNKVADAAKKAHDQVNSAASNLNATYYTSQQFTQKYDKDTQGLTKAKDNEKEAHKKVNDAALDYSATIKLFGPNSKPAIQAAEDLTKKKDAETKAQQSVSWWTHQVYNDLNDERNAANNLSGAIDNLASKNSKLTGILNKSSTTKGGLPQFAGGVKNFQGGAAIVGEEGPELVYLPQGSSVIPAPQTQQVLSGSTNSTGTSKQQSVYIDSITITTAAAASEFFRNLDQDNLLLGRGLTPNRGTR